MSARTAAAFLLSLSALIVTGALTGAQVPAPERAQPRIAQALRDRVQQAGRVRVLVELNVRSEPEGVLQDVRAVLRQRQLISNARARMLQRIPAAAQRQTHRYQTVPLVALDVDANELTALESAGPDVVRVVEDAVLRPILAESAPLIQSDQAWEAGFDGTGTTIAVLDTGIDATHPFLAGKVIEEACYSTTTAGVSRSTCPSGADEQVGPGAGVPCSMADCVHGTHVAGIAAGSGASAGVAFSGVAKGANLMAVQVFSEIINPFSCGGATPCAGAYTSDIIAGLERVYALAAQRHIVAVNMSLGGATSPTTCDSDPTKPIIDNLRSIGVATVIAAGNSGFTSRLSTPGCVSTAVSVGSTNKADEVSYFSNAAPFMSLFAPGEAITSSVPGGGYDVFSGTSMATPHVAGTWAILKQALPTASVTDILSALRATGRPIVDTRPGGTVTIPREQLFQALASLVPVTNPAPALTGISPQRGRANSSFTLMVTGSSFNAFSTVRWNGADVPTTVLNTRSIRAAVPASALPAVGTASVTVFTAAPGGGTSAPATFTIDPPPTLTLSASPVAAGGSETVSLANGFGNQYDWIALAATGAADASYLQWTYVGNGVTDRTWTVTMPTTPGTYEFRLFLNNGFTRVATSAPVTVDPAVSPVPVIASLSPAAASVGGAAFTLTVNGSKFVNASVVQWNGTSRPTTFVSASQLRASIAASDIASVGTAQVTVSTPAPGGGTSAALPFSVAPLPSLAISAPAVAGGASETVTLTNGPGGTFDWIALASTSAPSTSYLQYIYVGAGVTTRTWTVAMPTAPGTYEFRLFLNNGYTRAATSPPITVGGGTGPAPVIEISATSVPGGSSTTMTLSNAPGGAFDWLALAATSAPNSSYLQYVYVGTGVTTRAWTVTMPNTPGTYEFRLFLNNGYTRAATSPPFTVTPGPNAVPSISSLSPAVASVGGPAFTLTVTGASFAPSSVVQWNNSPRPTTFVSATQLRASIEASDVAVVGTALVTVFSPPPAGGTSAAVAFAINPPPSLDVSATSVAVGGSVTVTLAYGLGGPFDWIALAPVSAPNNSYVQYIYVGSGNLTRTWTVAMPGAPGTYEFRLFLNNGYTRAATSAPIAVMP